MIKRAKNFFSMRSSYNSVKGGLRTCTSKRNFLFPSIFMRSFSLFFLLSLFYIIISLYPIFSLDFLFFLFPTFHLFFLLPTLFLFLRVSFFFCLLSFVPSLTFFLSFLSLNFLSPYFFTSRFFSFFRSPYLISFCHSLSLSFIYSFTS